MTLNKVLEIGYEATQGIHLEDPEDRFEDRSIILPTGDRACINWELSKRGFSELNLSKKKCYMTDKELLASAQKEAEEWRSNNYY